MNEDRRFLKAEALIVDDEVTACDLLEKYLAKEGHKTRSVHNGYDAIELIKEKHFDVIILDVKMPGIDGLETLRRLRAIDRDCVVIMLTAMDDLEMALSAMKEGADEFLRKPVLLPELGRYIESAMEKKRLRQENIECRKNLKRKVAQETAALLKMNAYLKKANLEIVRAISEAIEGMDPYIRGHCCRVRALALAMGKELGLSGDQLETLEYGALLHDIGNIGIRTDIKGKKGALTDDEYEHIKKHPEVGYDIISRVEFLRSAAHIVRNHHERFNGGGYPDGVPGDELDLLVKIVSIADAYDAMTSDRPHRRGMPVERALEILNENKGSQFDPDLVELFIDKKIYLVEK